MYVNVFTSFLLYLIFVVIRFLKMKFSGGTFFGFASSKKKSKLNFGQHLLSSRQRAEKKTKDDQRRTSDGHLCQLPCGYIMLPATSATVTVRREAAAPSSLGILRCVDTAVHDA